MIQLLLERCARFFRYWLKAIEFRYQTWKNMHEIRRAYTSRRSILGWVRARLVFVATIFGCCCVMVLCGWAIVRVTPHAVRWLATVRTTSAMHRSHAPNVALAAAVAPISTIAIDSSANGLDTDTVSIRQPSGEELDTANVDMSVKRVASEMKYALVANKAEKLIYLLETNGNEWRDIRHYVIAVGENDGPKQRAGDKKTPEGQYFIVGQKDKSEITSIYGPMSYVLNYPNKYDMGAGRTGQGIWIHGTAPDSVPVQTRGCLELSNSELMELSGYLGFGIGTPVKIINKTPPVNPIDEISGEELVDERRLVVAEYERRANQIAAFVHQWENAWETKNLDGYVSMYDTASFSAQGVGWDAWVEKKRRTFQIYNFIEVNIGQMVLSDFSSSTAVVKFKQAYSSDAMKVTNGKRLSLVKTGDEWKISREETFSQEELLL